MKTGHSEVALFISDFLMQARAFPFLHVCGTLSDGPEQPKLHLRAAVCVQPLFTF